MQYDIILCNSMSQNFNIAHFNLNLYYTYVVLSMHN